MFTLYLALDRRALERYSLTGVNYWIETVPRGFRTDWSNWDASPPNLLLSLAARFAEEGCNDPELIPAEVFTCVPGDRFARWHGTRVLKRGSEYEDLKEQIVDHLLQSVERTWPGFRQFVRYAEGATPLTIESYTRHLQGAAYGLSPAPGRYSNRALRVATGVPGLLLTGQDVSTAGVIGAFYGGILAASAVLGRNVKRLLLR
jgi:all-trans-retinol 13,14-reductase